MTILRIGWDARPIAQRWTGDRTYLVSIVAHIARAKPKHECFLFYRPPGDETPELATVANWIPIPATIGWLWTFVQLPRAVAHYNVDLLHGDYIMPPIAPCPMVVTIHDATPALFVERASLKVRLLTNLLIFISAHRSKFVITGSECARCDIARCYRVPRHKIYLTPYGVESHFQPLDKAWARARVAERYGIDDPFILTVNFHRPRKNAPRLVQAFALMRQRNVPACKLVLAGAVTKQLANYLRSLVSPDIAQDLIFTGYVRDEDLPILYNAAVAFAYPSLYEGYGLPVLEAMACGTPVVCSNASSLPEVAGDAALLIDPRDVIALADALECILTDEQLRAELILRGMNRAKQMTWERTAQLTLAIFRKALD